MGGDRVDGEVAARQVLVQRDAESDLGVATVGRDILPERGDLVGAVLVVEDGHGPVLDSDRHGAAEQRLDFRWRRGGRDVDDGVGQPGQRAPAGLLEQHVAHRPADEPRLVARREQPRRDLPNGLGDLR